MSVPIFSVQRSPLERVVQITWFAALIVVVSLTLLPGNSVSPPLSLNDKLLHFVAYFGLGILGGTGWPERRGLFLVAMPLLGLGLECTQGAFVPGRVFDWGDAVANAIGAFAGVASSVIARRLLFKDS